MAQKDFRSLVPWGDSNHCYFGTAAPTAGTYAVGDQCLNTGTSGPYGWTCSVAGTPGTWVEFGAALSGNATVGGTLGVTGALTASSTLAVTGTTTMTGGLVATGRSKYSTVPIGSVAYGSFGGDTAYVAGTIYIADIFIPRNITLTGVGVLNGTAVGTDKLIVALFNSAGTKVANSALAGTTASGTDAFQEIAFTGTYAAVGPARYWIGVQCDGTTAKGRMVVTSTFIDVLTKSTAGSFGTVGNQTVPTTFTTAVGPIAYVY